MAESIKIAIIVDQNVAHTWEYYFNQINLWWPRTYFSSPRTKRFLIQTFMGGKAFEDFGEGDGLIWGDVIGVDYLRSLEIRGNLTKAFGGPVLTFEKYEFERVNGKTRLTLSVDFLGIVKESTIQSLKKGWEELLKVHFLNYCREKT